MSEIFDRFRLAQRVAVVTGGAGLLGAEFCRTLVEAGAHVVIADVDLGQAETLAQTLNQRGRSSAEANAATLPRALAIATDVTSPASVQAMVEVTLRTYGHLDILVNSAALDPKFDPEHAPHHTDAFEDYPLEAWNQALGVNLTGTFLCCQAVAKPMLAQGRGVMINICSIYGIVAPDQRLYEQPGKPPRYKPVYYTVTKAGVLGLTRYLAAYYAGKNIRVNALTPGGVYNQHDEQFVQAYSARTVLGRMARKDELNGALLFLASDASSYMTGANLIVDGGWTTW